MLDSKMYKSMPRAVTVLIGLVLIVLIEHGIEFFSKFEGGDGFAIAKALFVSSLMECFGAIGLYIGFNRLTRYGLTRFVFLLGSIVCLVASFFIQLNYYEKEAYGWMYAALLPTIVAIASAGVSALEREIADTSEIETQNKTNAIELQKTKSALNQANQQKAELESQLQETTRQLEAIQTDHKNGNYVPLAQFLTVQGQLQVAQSKVKDLELVASRTHELESQLSENKLATVQKTGQLEYNVTELKTQLLKAGEKIKELTGQREEMTRQLQTSQREVLQLKEREQKLLTAGNSMTVQMQPVSPEVIAELKARLDEGSITVEEAVIRSNGEIGAAAAQTRLRRAGKRDTSSSSSRFSNSGQDMATLVS